MECGDLLPLFGGRQKESGALHIMKLKPCADLKEFSPRKLHKMKPPMNTDIGVHRWFRSHSDRGGFFHCFGIGSPDGWF
jgi:hypothetical protein